MCLTKTLVDCTGRKNYEIEEGPKAKDIKNFWKEMWESEAEHDNKAE